MREMDKGSRARVCLAAEQEFSELDACENAGRRAPRPCFGTARPMVGLPICCHPKPREEVVAPQLLLRIQEAA
jgi:serine/threonine-protein kinase RIO1